MSSEWVIERMGLAIPAGAVDRVRGIVRNVRVCGPVSPSWNRCYPARVLAAAVERFAAVVNIGHHFDYERGRPLPAPVADVFGRIESPRMNGDGVNGDLRFNAEHTFATPFGWAAENDPQGYSFSPLMNVRWEKDRDSRGYLVAAEIVEVLSCDIVDRGGTTESIFESWNQRIGSNIPAVSTVAELAGSRKVREIMQGLIAGDRTPATAPTQRVTPADLVRDFDPPTTVYRPWR